MRIRNTVPIEEQRKTCAIVAAALRRGQLIRPRSCSWCGRSDKRIEAHHPDYDRPLAVVWVCSSCHHRHHRKYRVDAWLRRGRARR